MSNAANVEIRNAAKEAGVCLWQIAERIGINDGNFSRKLRRELPEREKQEILQIIQNIKTQKVGVS